MFLDSFVKKMTYLLIFIIAGDKIKRIKETTDVFDKLLQSNIKETLSTMEMDLISQLFRVVELLQQPVIKIVKLAEDNSTNSKRLLVKEQNPLVQKQLFSRESDGKSILIYLKKLIQAISSYFDLICKNYFVEYKVRNV